MSFDYARSPFTARCSAHRSCRETRRQDGAIGRLYVYRPILQSAMRGRRAARARV